MRWRKGQIVLALEPALGRSWILATLLDPKQRLVEFLEHAVWRGCRYRVDEIRKCDLATESGKETPCCTG